jgi:peptide deformylase
MPAETHALSIIEYPHPVLRHRCKPIRRVDAELRAVVGEMFHLMYQAKGIGLAASQVGLPFRLFVANLSAEPDQGEELVFINPVISQPKGNEEAEEGCLSLPGLYAPVRRPATVHISAYNLEGDEIAADLEGLAARCVQHEVDHLDGVLFIDRLAESAALELKEKLLDMEDRFEGRIQRGEMPDKDQSDRRVAEFEERYC